MPNEGESMPVKIFRRSALTFLFFVSFLSVALAGDYPERPIHVVVPYGAAGTMDIAARILFERVSQIVGQPIVIENRPGAGGNIGIEQVVQSSPDGYTLVIADPMTSLSANVSLMPNLGFNPLKDLIPIGNFGSTGVAIVVTPSLPVKTLAEFIAYAKERPGQVLYGSTGIGSPGHLNGEMFCNLVGIKAVHVPYRVGSQGTTDLLMGRVQFWLAQIPTRLQQIRRGELRVLAVAGSERSRDLPEIPTVKELGYGDFDASSDYAVYAPAGTPAAVVNTLFVAIQTALKDETVVGKLYSAGLEPKLMTGDAVTKVLQDQVARWSALIKDAHIQLIDQ
jgi:tripartite-type tricarboxylate transporter receptor subunit TctC